MCTTIFTIVLGFYMAIIFLSIVWLNWKEHQFDICKKDMIGGCQPIDRKECGEVLPPKDD